MNYGRAGEPLKLHQAKIHGNPFCSKSKQHKHIAVPRIAGQFGWVSAALFFIPD